MLYHKRLKSFKLNTQSWRVSYDPTMQGAVMNCGKGEYDGVCLPECKLITLDPNCNELPLTFKHELVHAILYTMESELAENEDFVSRFSELLHEASTSLKYKTTLKLKRG